MQKRLREELQTHYLNVLPELVQEVQVERRLNEALLKEVCEVAAWLAEREQSASIVGLYGDQQKAITGPDT